MQLGFRYFIEEFGSQLVRVKIVYDYVREKTAFKVHFVKADLEMMFPDIFRNTNDVWEGALQRLEEVTGDIRDVHETPFDRFQKRHKRLDNNS